MAEFIVTTLNDELDSTNPNATLADFGGAGDLSLREALVLTQQNPGADTITFASNLAGGKITISHQAFVGTLVIAQDVTINGDVNGDGTPDITIDGRNVGGINGSGAQIFHVNSGSLDLQGLTLSNGFAIGSGEGYGPVVANNNAPGGGGGGGGGLGAGGAVYVAGGAALSVTDVIFDSNAVRGGYGGESFGTGGTGGTGGPGPDGEAGGAGGVSGAGGNGGFGAGGGGGGGTDWRGGTGGFGGGGGGEAGSPNHGSLLNYSSGGFGGGAGQSQTGVNLPAGSGGGGGGAGFGGAVFISEGADFSIGDGVVFRNGQVGGGVSGWTSVSPNPQGLSGTGQADGSAFFLQHSDVTITATAGKTITISDTIADSTDPQHRAGTGSGHLIKDGDGTLNLTATNTFGGAITVEHGTLQIDGSIANAAVEIENGATLTGLGATGALTLDQGGAIVAQIGATKNGVAVFHHVNGTVTLNNATLSLSIANGLPATVGAAYKLIDNDGTDAVAGQFNGLAEGQVFLMGDRAFKISYHGGDGNDVVVTEQNRQPVTTLPAVVSGEQDTPIAFNGADTVSVADPGAGPGTITVNLQVLHGEFDLTAAGGVTISGDDTSFVSVFGTLADVNATLASLKYTPDAGFNGTDSMQVVSYDGTGTPNALDMHLSTITVAPVTNLTLTGDDNNNVLTGSAGDDLIKGLGGDDTLIGGAGNNLLEGGTGNDLYIVSSPADVIVEYANEGTDEVHTDLSSFSIAPFANVENLTGTATTAQALTGNAGDNVITGGDGGDSLLGGNGHDTLIGGAGNDRLNGGAGADTMSGGSGDDTYVVDNAGDTVSEAAGGGNDTVIAKADYTLAAGSEIETLRAGSDAGLTLTGNEIANRIVGGAGDDRLVGGGGHDILTGGAGSDTFVFEHAATSTDTVRDFVSGVDHIELSAADFGGGLVAGALDPNAFAANPTGKPADASDRFVYDTSNGNLYFDADGHGHGASRELVAKFDGGVMLHASDFLIV